MRRVIAFAIMHITVTEHQPLLQILFLNQHVLETR